MEAVHFHETSVEPRDGSCLDHIKSFRDINRLLTLKTRRDATVDHEPSTVDKASLMMLSSIMLDCGLDDAKALLDSVQGIIIDVLEVIRGADDPVLALHEAIEFLNGDEGKKALTVHRTTVSNMIPHADREQLDKTLENQYRECIEELDGLDASSDAIIIAIDDTHDKIRSMYFNGNYSYVVVGQTSTWDRGFVYPAEYDSTHQLFMGFRHQDYRMLDSEKKGARPWLESLSEKCMAARRMGIDQVLVEGDRGFFNAGLLARAYLGLIDPNAPAGKEPRVVVPRKFTREKTRFKWDFLLDESKPRVFIDTIDLSPYTNPDLRQVCEKNLEKSSKSLYPVPYACVAAIDEYSSKNKRTLAEARSRALIVQDGIDKATKELDEAIKVYQEHYKNLKGKDAKPPNFGRGNRRKKFLNKVDKQLHDVCYRIHSKLASWKEEKATLLKSLMFFAISLRPGEDPASDPARFIAMARDYHERWGIENGFRDVKSRFLSRCRSRKPCIRQFHWILAMMLYNRWEVERKRLALDWFQDHDMKNDLFDKQQPWNRRKHEQECPSLQTAVGYLVDLWCQGIMSVLKNEMGEKK
ncbi:MAG: transposase [Candidatus Hodarchaeota archaeon]